jgi:hypothetical protein
MKFSLEQVESFGVTTGVGVKTGVGVGVTTGAGVGVTTGAGVGVTTGAGVGVGKHVGNTRPAELVVETPLPSLSVHTFICVEYLISQLKLVN